MAIAKRVKWYLDTHHVDYELISHKHTMSSLESAQAAHVPEGLVAKSVLLEDERGYVLAVIPASCRLQLEEIEDQTGRRLELATEGELLSLFRGCELGAIPPLGEAFNIPTAVDDSLLRLPLLRDIPKDANQDGLPVMLHRVGVGINREVGTILAEERVRRRIHGRLFVQVLYSATEAFSVLWHN